MCLQPVRARVDRSNTGILYQCPNLHIRELRKRGSVINPKSKSKQALTPLGEQLLNLAKKRKPVLLYGESNSDDREDLIREVHLKNGGIDSPWDIVGCDVKIKSLDDINNEMLKAIKDEDFERAKNLYIKRESTAKTLMCLNWGGRDGSYVFSELKSLQSSPNFELEIITEYIAKKTREFCFKQIFSKYLDRSRRLIEREGTLFIDNLSCHEEDKRSYEHIAIIIEKRYEDTTSSIWLICYVHNIESFPDPFIELFEQIPLDGKDFKPEKSVRKPKSEKIIKLTKKKNDNEAKEIKIDNARKLLVYDDKKAKLEPKQIELFELLWRNKDKVVSRTEIDKALWPEDDNKEPISPIQIEQQVNSLRGSLDQLGIKRSIIKTHKKTQLAEGAYEFNSNISAYLKKPM